MAKTIKFNLICDERPVRTIEDLQNNFSIEDVLAYYNNKLLHRWLHVRGYEKELEAVSAITSTDPMEIIKELIRIFEVVSDEKKVEESIYMLKYLEERKKCYIVYEKENNEIKRIIDDYAASYWKLVDDIIQNPNDAAIIKANIAEMVSNYTILLSLNHTELFWKLTTKSPMAIMCLLMNEKTRDYYLPVKKVEEDGTVKLDVKSNPDKNEMYEEICDMIRRSEFKASLGANLLSFSGTTHDYWQDIVTGKKCMIIRMGDGDFVRSAGVVGGDLSKEDILNKFVIVDGIDYKSKSVTHELLYMEV